MYCMIIKKLCTLKTNTNNAFNIKLQIGSFEMSAKLNSAMYNNFFHDLPELLKNVLLNSKT